MVIASCDKLHRVVKTCPGSCIHKMNQSSLEAEILEMHSTRTTKFKYIMDFMGHLEQAAHTLVHL